MVAVHRTWLQLRKFSCSSSYQKVPSEFVWKCSWARHWNHNFSLWLPYQGVGCVNVLTAWSLRKSCLATRVNVTTVIKTLWMLRLAGCAQSNISLPDRQQWGDSWDSLEDRYRTRWTIFFMIVAGCTAECSFEEATELNATSVSGLCYHGSTRKFILQQGAIIPDEIWAAAMSIRRHISVHLCARHVKWKQLKDTAEQIKRELQSCVKIVDWLELFKVNMTDSQRKCHSQMRWGHVFCLLLYGLKYVGMAQTEVTSGTALVRQVASSLTLKGNKAETKAKRHR